MDEALAVRAGRDLEGYRLQGPLLTFPLPGGQQMPPAVLPAPASACRQVARAGTGAPGCAGGCVWGAAGTGIPRRWGIRESFAKVPLIPNLSLFPYLDSFVQLIMCAWAAKAWLSEMLRAYRPSHHICIMGVQVKLPLLFSGCTNTYALTYVWFSLNHLIP